MSRNCTRHKFEPGSKVVHTNRKWRIFRRTCRKDARSRHLITKLFRKKRTRNLPDCLRQKIKSGWCFAIFDSDYLAYLNKRNSVIWTKGTLIFSTRGPSWVEISTEYLAEFEQEDWFSGGTETENKVLAFLTILVAHYVVNRNVIVKYSFEWSISRATRGRAKAHSLIVWLKFRIRSSLKWRYLKVVRQNRFFI